jgi:hypothetical protein
MPGHWQLRELAGAYVNGNGGCLNVSRRNRVSLDFPSKESRFDDSGTSGEGTLRLTGGSRRFAGVNGQCKYKTDDLPGDWNIIANCQWLYSFPYR